MIVNEMDLNESVGNESSESVVNVTDDGESGLDEVIVNVTVEEEYFYWDRIVINNYSGEVEEVDVRLKVPKELENVTDKIDNLKSEESGGYISVQSVSEDNWGEVF